MNILPPSSVLKMEAVCSYKAFLPTYKPTLLKNPTGIKRDTS
jgi:hypothetical protein